jgi:predicted amidohydrolase YtcJ
MRRLPLPLLALAALACHSAPAADLVLENATVYTVDDQLPKAEAVAVSGGKIVFVGSTADVAPYRGPGTRVVDLKGAFVYPGWADAHYHLAGVGERETTLNLEGTRTKDAFLARIKERVDRTPPGEWVVGRGWIETFWTPPVFPTRHDLDAIAPNNPVALGRADGHALIANTKALELAGITKATKAPFGGAINKDARGELTGMLIDRAQGLMGRAIPSPTEAQDDSALVIGARRSTELGWTQVQDAGTDWATVGRMRRLYGAGQIKLRVYDAILGPSAATDSLLAVGPSLDEFDGRYTVRTIKVVMDGALGSRGAALLEPYSDDPGNRGLITTDTAAFKTMMVAALQKGIQVETHAIGDRANHILLNLYEWAFQQVPASDRAVAEPRWRDEHTQIVAVADLPRFKQLNIIPSMQPSHAIGDLYFAPSRLGAKRLEGAYAWKTFLDMGLPVPGGSDAPVERGEPMIEFYAAVTRRDLQGNAGPDSLWHPEQKVSREQALKMFTLYPAFAAFQEHVRGSIAVGKWADFTILDQDVMTVPNADILKTKPVMTVIGGEVVYAAPGRQ